MQYITWQEQCKGTKVCFDVWLGGTVLHAGECVVGLVRVAWDSSHLCEPEAGAAYKMQGLPHPSPCDPIP